MAKIDLAEGRRLYGEDPLVYHRVRPGYPERIFEILTARCGLKAGTRTFEIGPGTGIASERLLELGASPLVLVEPDRRLANFLADNFADAADRIRIRSASFEQVRLTRGWFDLGVCASAFHWVDEETALLKIARCLRPGGWWAMWWNLFSEGTRTDEFYQATQPLLKHLDRSPSSGVGRPPFALDKEMRLASLRATNAFQKIKAETTSFTAEFSTERVVQLYSTFSPIRRLNPAKRQPLLHRLGEIADEQFGGTVEIRILVPVYTAQRR